MKVSRAVITGASSGIGEEFARQLATRGVNLVIAARRTERLEILAAELREKNKIEVEVVTLDLEDPKSPQSLFEAATKAGPVDLLVNNAGRGPYREFLKTRVDDHQKVMQLNVVALTTLCHLFADHMQKNFKESIIINVASVASFAPVPRYAVYCATKSFVRVFSEILNYELKGTGVSVSCLCPGGTKTEFLEKNNQKLHGEQFLMPVHKVVKAGIKGALAGKPVIIPGFFNKVSSTIPAFLPNSIIMRITEKAMKMAVEEKDKEVSNESSM